jgi:hypothetical protein
MMNKLEQEMKSLKEAHKKEMQSLKTRLKKQNLDTVHKLRIELESILKRGDMARICRESKLSRSLVSFYKIKGTHSQVKFLLDKVKKYRSEEEACEYIC